MTIPTGTAARALLDKTIAGLGPVSRVSAERAHERHARLTKPSGSLGTLEKLGIRLAAIQDTERPKLCTGTVVIFASDHGVTAQGVSAYPSEVTQQMVSNFRYGGAAINAMARISGLRVRVVDVGVNGPLIPSGPASVGLGRGTTGLTVETCRIRNGTADMTREPAMTRKEALQALALGIVIAGEEIARGADLIALGEMGIGNTTAASAIAAVLTGQSVGKVTGPGTGLDAAQVLSKVRVIERALSLHAAAASDSVDVLATVGGLELAALAGATLGAAAARVPVLVDGFITSAAALVAERLAPNAVDYMIAAHRSPEPGHSLLMERLGLEPILDLGLRLGEGTGAAAAFPIVRQAAAVLSDMATFEEAAVSGPQ